MQGTAVAQNGCAIHNTTTKNNEQITYKVYYTFAGAWIGAGEAVFTNQLERFNGGYAYHVIGDGRTYKSYDWFFKVRDRYETYMDTSSMLPLKFVRNVNEGGFKFSQNVIFNHNTKRAISTKGVKKVPSCVQDVLSSIYYARNIDFSKYKVGAKIPFSLFLDDEVYEIYIRYLGKEVKHTKHGVFNTIKFKPLLINGTIFKGGEEMMVWVTDDENKIPVHIETPIIVGSIRVDLIGYKNLRNSAKGVVKMYK